MTETQAVRIARVRTQEAHEKLQAACAALNAAGLQETAHDVGIEVRRLWVLIQKGGFYDIIEGQCDG